MKRQRNLVQFPFSFTTKLIFKSCKLISSAILQKLLHHHEKDLCQFSVFKFVTFLRDYIKIMTL